MAKDVNPPPTLISPTTAWMTREIPKPKNPADFERWCVVLFQAALRDPSALRVGRNGQDQGGIDIPGRRDSRHDQRVGIQCRLINKRDGWKKILADCRVAAAKWAVTEIIFATTAPDDAEATKLALKAEEELRLEGIELKVTILGWGQLQELISRHPEAYNLFFPAAFASLVEQQVVPSIADIQKAVREAVVDLHLHGQMSVRESAQPDASEEDPRLHARIDTFRDLFKKDRETLIAKSGLIKLLDGGDLRKKPWARFRIEFNLGSIAMDLGMAEEAVARFEAAHALRPSDPESIGSLALARSMQGRFEEAMDLARRALSAEKPAAFAVAVLLQAAARSGWSGDPVQLVPDGMHGGAPADLGLAEFLRWRAEAGWERRALDLVARHAEDPDFRLIRGLATLSLLTSTGAVVPGARAPIDAGSIQRATDDLAATAEHYLSIGYADKGDLAAHINNAGAMLRLAGRRSESEALLRRGISLLPENPNLRRQLALSLLARDERTEAVAMLRGNDPENQLLAAELISSEDPRRARDEVAAIDPSDLPTGVARLRTKLMGEVGIALDEADSVTAAVCELRAANPLDLAAELIEIGWAAKHDATEGGITIRERCRALARSLPADASVGDRYVIAGHLSGFGLAEEAADVIEPIVDPEREGPAAILYLQSLAAARRDAMFTQAIATIGPTTRDPVLLWTIATHAWNTGDLSNSEQAVDRLLAEAPDNIAASRLKLELLVRRNRGAELLEMLSAPIDSSRSPDPDQDCRLASILGHFGFAERGAALAYRLFLENRDLSRAWMTLAILVLGEGRGAGPRQRRGTRVQSATTRRSTSNTTTASRSRS